MTVRHLVVGPPQHGVTRFAAQLAAALPATAAGAVTIGRQLGPEDLAHLLTLLPDDGALVHLNVTDALFGRSARQAREVIVALSRVRPIGVTLHDLPQPSDGLTSMARRDALYTAVGLASRYVVVSSEHERRLLAASVDRALGPAAVAQMSARVHVVPLPVEPLQLDWQEVNSGVRLHRRAPRTVGMLGFVYPGKGHEDVVRALPDLPGDVRMAVLGRASDGHEDVLAGLERMTTRLGRRLDVSGYIPDADLRRRLHSVAVPVAAHRHWSASGSVNTWISAGRKPLVPAHPYTLEIAERLPGTVIIYENLTDALWRALRNPETTWLDPMTRLFPGTPDVAARYAAIAATVDR